VARGVKHRKRNKRRRENQRKQSLRGDNACIMHDVRRASAIIESIIAARRGIVSGNGDGINKTIVCALAQAPKQRMACAFSVAPALYGSSGMASAYML